MSHSDAKSAIYNKRRRISTSNEFSDGVLDRIKFGIRFAREKKILNKFITVQRLQNICFSI